MSQTANTQKSVRSLVPARMDRLPWTRFHWSIVVGLGTAWILDGLEIQMVSASGFQHALHMSSGEVGFTGTIYLLGQVIGALGFGRLADRLGRKRFFIITLLVYLIGSGVAGFAPNMAFLWVFRFIAGMGIGGEYTAINSAIDELIPSHFRGRVDIAINGTYWGGALLGAVANIFLLSSSHQAFSDNWGWRIGFFIGPVLGLIIIYLRRHIPESPRWQMTHGHEAEAEKTVDEIEDRIKGEGKTLHPDPVDDSKALEVTQIKNVGALTILKIFFVKYPKRAITTFVMFVTQSFLYNAIFFTYALVLKNFYHIGDPSVYFIPFAIGNLIGPLVLGHLFDTWGRRKMILLTYGVSGVVLAISAFLFNAGALNALTQTIFWCIAFFFASAGASSAYLVASESFPIELRSQSISYFFAIGQAAGAFAPVIYGSLIGNGTDRGPLFAGYLLGASLMIVGGVVAFFLGVDAERKSLEEVAEPLTKVGATASGK
jgi:MFS family permease